MVTIDPSLTEDGEYSKPQRTSTDNFPPLEVVPESPSAISELQEALGGLLLAQKEEDVGNFTYSYMGRAQWRPFIPPVIKPNWTGAFNLFSFPRELRDRIYYWYLKRQRRLVDRHKRPKYYYSDEAPDTSEEIVKLFLTSRQVYQEAYEVFYRYNLFEMRVGRGGLAGTVRLLPDLRVRKTQRISMEYYESRVNLAGVPEEVQEGRKHPACDFTRMMEDAYALKKHFPQLREFTVGWNMYSAMWHGQEIRPEDFTEEERVDFWLNWMRAWVKVAKVAPPSWLRFEFRYTYNHCPVQGHLSALNTAYKMLIRESAGVSEEEKERRLEESGRKWLEEAWPDGKRTRKKRNSR